MIQFTSFHQYQPGLLVSLLSQSYADYFHYDPGCEEVWRQGWQQYDRDVFQHPDTIGACGFVTCLAGQAPEDVPGLRLSGGQPEF